MIMSTEIRSKNIIESFLELTAAMMLIVQCRTMWMHLKDYGMTVNRASFVVLAAALFGLILCTAAGRRGDGCLLGTEYRKKLVVLAAMAVYSGVFITLNPVNFKRVIRCSIILILMAAVVMADEEGERTRSIMRKYCTLAEAAAALSLLCWLLISVLRIVPMTGLAVTDWSETGAFETRETFLGIYYETQWLVYGTARNSALFTEAPMASFTFSTAFIVEELLLKRGNRYGTVVLALAVVSTFSTTGWMVLLAVLFYRLLLADNSLFRPGRTARLLILIAAATAVLAMTVIVVNKIMWGSGNVRINDYVIGFEAWLEHPLIGGGFESLEYLQSFMPEWRMSNCGYSNSPMQILAQGGLYLAAAYALSLAKGISYAVAYRDRDVLAFIVVFAAMMVLTTIPYQYITFLVLVVLANAGKVCGCDTEKETNGRED